MKEEAPALQHVVENLNLPQFSSVWFQLRLQRLIISLRREVFEMFSSVLKSYVPSPPGFRRRTRQWGEKKRKIFTVVTLLKERSCGPKKKFLTRKIIIKKNKSPPAAEAGAARHLTGAEEVGVTLMASSVIPVFRAAREEEEGHAVQTGDGSS